MNLIGYSLEEEAFSGSFQRCSDGKTRMACGKNHHSVFRIEGLDSIRRFDGVFVVAPEDARLAEKLRTAKLADIRASSGGSMLILSKLPEKTDLTAESPRNTIKSNGKILCSASFALVDGVLKFRAEVVDDTPFVNKGGDPRMLFKTGDSFNIELGNSAHSTDDAALVSPGDVRLLVAPYKSGIACVAYRYKVPGTKNPEVFSSPWNKTKVDRVEVLKNADISVVRGKSGYVLSGGIPLAELGIDLKQPLSGDFGVIFSDKSGTRNAYIVFHNNPAKGITSDVPSEIRLDKRFWTDWK
jgi:hypothetical protein